jgi:transposase
MQGLNEAENLFEDEIKRLKKEKASWQQATKHKRLGKGNMRFASDLMSRSEKIKYRKAGRIVTTNLFDKILSLDEFNNLENHEKRNMMAYWRNTYSNKQIQKEMRVGNAQYYKIVADLGLPKATRTNSDSKKQPRKVAAIKVIEQQQIQLPETVVQTTPVQEIIVDGMHLIFNGTYQPESIIKQLLKFGALLEGETDDFYIELKLVQKAAK